MATMWRTRIVLYIEVFVCLSAIVGAHLQAPSSATNVLVVYAHDSLDQAKQLASSIKDGAESAGAVVRLKAVEDANYKADIYEWADGIIIGSGVFNGNAAPSIIEFLDTFDFQDHLLDKVGSVFATGGGTVAGLEPVLGSISRGLRTFGVTVVGGTSWENAHGTGVVTNRGALDKHSSSLARDQGARTAQLASILKQAKPSPAPSPPGPSPVLGTPPSWGETWTASVSANMTQVGYDAGLVIVKFTGQCKDPKQQRMRTVYGDFDTVLTRCDLGREFIIDPPSRGGGCTVRVIGKGANPRICEACSCPFCVRDTQGKFTHGEHHPSNTRWTSKEHTSIYGRDVVVWRGVAVSSEGEGPDYALSTSIAYSADDEVTPVFVNVSHPLWTQTQARIDNFSSQIDFHDFDIPDICFKSATTLV